MTNVKLPSAAADDLHMVIHTSTRNKDIRLAREFQKYISEPTRAHGLLDHDKDRKCYSKQKWAECAYHFQGIKDVSYISVNMSCATTEFPSLPFCDP